MKVAKLIEDPCSCGRGPIDRYPPAKVCGLCAREKEMKRYEVKQALIKQQRKQAKAALA